MKATWTVETLKQHYDALLHEKDKALVVALAAQERAAAAAAAKTGLLVVIAIAVLGGLGGLIMTLANKH